MSFFFKFLKNCPFDFHKIFHSHSTHKGAPACTKASKSYDWNVRNIAKINPKMARNNRFSTFSDFHKNCPYDSNEILYSPSTLYYGPLCVVLSNSYNWDWSESEVKRTKPTPLPHMRLLLKHAQDVFMKNSENSFETPKGCLSCSIRLGNHFFPKLSKKKQHSPEKI